LIELQHLTLDRPSVCQEGCKVCGRKKEGQNNVEEKRRERKIEKKERKT
jgi:hypothetical protein